MGYTSTAIKGISWMGALRLGTRALTVVRIAILARMLSPLQFGTVGIATIALGFVEILTETGINVFLVQERGKIDTYINTAWIVSIIRGFVISLTIVVAAPFIASFFHAPDALPLLLLTSIVPILRGFINPAIIQFQKELAFHREFWFRFWIFTADSSIAILLVFITRDGASLIWGFIAGATLEVLLSFLLVKPTPRFAFEKEKFLKVLHRGKWVTMAGILDFVFRHGDDVVVGRILPIASLGLYTNAYKISELPLTEIAAVVSKVTFPVFSKISDDIVRLKRAFFRTTISIALLTIPIGVVLFFFPQQLILLILGPAWVEAAPALRILSLFGVVRAISGSIFVLFLAMKQQKYITITLLVSTGALAITIVPFVLRFGIEGAAFSGLIASVVGLIASLFYLPRLLRSTA